LFASSSLPCALRRARFVSGFGVAAPRVAEAWSETEHAKLLLADWVGRVDRLRLAEIGDRLGAAAQRLTACFKLRALCWHLALLVP
jgi:hypothetical protein